MSQNKRIKRMLMVLLVIFFVFTGATTVSAIDNGRESEINKDISKLIEYIEKNGMSNFEESKYDMSSIRKLPKDTIKSGWVFDRTTRCNMIMNNFDLEEKDKLWIIEQFNDIDEVGKKEKEIIYFFDKHGINHKYLRDVLMYLSYHVNSNFEREIEEIYSGNGREEVFALNSLDGGDGFEYTSISEKGVQDYALGTGNQEISLNSGAAVFNYNLVSLKGAGDLNLSLNIKYNSDRSNVYDYAIGTKRVRRYDSNSITYYKKTTLSGGGPVYSVPTEIKKENTEDLFVGLKKDDPKKGFESRYYYEVDRTNKSSRYIEVKANALHKKKETKTGHEFATGWIFDLPRLVLEPTFKDVVGIYIPGKGNFEVKFDELVDYKLKDIKIIKKNDTNDYIFEPRTNYLVRYSNGYEELFDSWGKLVYQRDRFGNKNKFEIAKYSHGLGYIKITDSTGRIIDVRRNDSQNKFEVRVDGALKKTIQLEDYWPNVAFNIHYGIHYKQQLVRKIVNSEGLGIDFDYRYETHKTNLLGNLEDDRTIDNYYVLLDTVSNTNNSKWKYDYNKIVVNQSRKGLREKFRVSSRKEYDDKNNLERTVTYSYVNNNTGYPQYKYLDEDKPYEYSISVKDGKIENKYVFNQKHLLIKEENRVNSKKIIEKNKYYDDKNQITKDETIRIDNGNQIKNTENYEFNDKGMLISYTGIKSQRNSQGIPLNRNNTIKKIYDDKNGLLKEKNYYVNNQYVREVNTLSSDRKRIIESQTFVNDVLRSKATYQYDDKGNIIGSKIFGKNDDWNQFIQIDFGYKGEGGRDAYQTSKTVKGVTNAAFGDVQDITESSKYTNEGFVKETTDGNGNIERYTYDSIGRILSVTKVADNSRVSYSYDNKNRTTTFTNENNDSFRFKYNHRGKIEDIISVKDGKTLYHYDYDNQGRLVRETISEKGYYRYTYYDDNRIRFKEVLQKNPNGTETLLGKSEFIYEDVIRDSVTGQMVTRNRTILHGDSNSPTREKREIYNQYGEMIRKEVLNSGTIYKETYTYDSIGREIQRKSPRGFQENWGNEFSFKTNYDFRGNVVSTTDVYGYSDEYIYNKLGQQAKARNKRNKSEGNKAYIESKYDEMGRVIESVIPQSINDRTRFLTRYDKNSNVTLSSIEIAKNDFRIKEMGYNHLNQLNMVKLNDGYEDMYTEYLYDKKGNMINIALGLDHKNSDIYTDKTIDYKYDELSQVVGKNGQADNYTFYEKDHYGNTEKKSEPNGNKISTEYDGLNRITSRIIKNKQNQVIESLQFRYSLAGEVVEIIKDGKSRKYTYDSMGRLKTDTDHRGYKKTSRYDSESNLTNLTVHKSGREIYDVSYVMDRMNRIHQVKKDGAVIATYEYDQNGNKKSVKFSNGFRTTYQYNLSNKLIRLENYRDFTQGSILMSAFDYEYTLDGNVKKENRYVNTKLVDETTFKYDKADRLIEEKSSNINNSYSYDRYHNRTSSKSKGLEELLENVSYGYDGMNRLTSIQKNSKNIQFTYDIGELRESKTVNGQRTDFIYQGNYLLIEDKGNTITKNIVGAGIIAREIEGALYYYIYDGLGNVTSITDSQGNIIKNYRYDAYGVEQNKDDNDNNPFRYKGYFYDKDSDLYYLGARFYNANTGRFINEDTNQGKISKPQSLNYYIYCLGNPVRYYDPDGHEQIVADSRHGGGSGYIEPESSKESLSDYLGRSVDQLIKGNYSEESTALGTAMEVAAGAAGVDIVADIRDITYDVTHWEWTWEHVGGTILDVAGVIPGIGVVKNLDEVWGVFKKTDKLVTSTKKTLKSACFTEGTLIVTEDGYKKIEDVQVGDMVLAKNIETGEQNYRLVLQTFVRKSYNLVLIKVNGKIIETTTEHPFWVMGKGWTEAGELEEDDILEDSDGNTVEIESIEYKEFENEITVYNFEVDKDHDYYVSRNNILVHNNDTCFKVADDIIEGADKADFIVTEGGTAVHTSQSKMIDSITDAGAVKIGPTNQTSEIGEIFHLDTPNGPMEIRVMPGRPNGGPYQGPRTINTVPGSREYIYPNGERIRGAVPKNTRKGIGHIHGQRP